MRAYVLGAALLLSLLPRFALAERVEVGHANANVEVRLLDSSEERILFEVLVGAFDKIPVLIDGETLHHVRLADESRILEPDLPELPCVCRSVVIPDEGRVEVTVLEAEFEEIPDVAVAPSKGVLDRTVDPSSVPYRFGRVYALDEWYPRDLARAGEPYILRDFRGMCVTVQPFQHNAHLRMLRVYTRLVVEARLAGPGGPNALVRHHRSRMSKEFRRIYDRHFLNFDQPRYAPVGEAGEMLMIVHDALHADAAPLAQWKNRMGIKTTLVDVSAVGADSTSIRDYIRSLYDSTNLAFVLLVGDAAEVPYPTTLGAAADPRYALVAGDDSYPDLFVGRLSASNSYHLRTQIERAVSFERYPQAGADWYGRSAGVASDDGPGDDGELDYEHLDVIRDRLLNHGYLEVDRIYDPGATAAEVAAAIEEGRGLVNYCGHGSRTTWGTTGFSNSHIGALRNHEKLPFIFNVACLNGEFTGGTCIAEAWLRAMHGGLPTGAIGVYASSLNQYWDPPMAAQDECIDLLVGGDRRTFGGLCYGGSCRMIDEYGTNGARMFASWHVFGDPSLRVRTGAPGPILVDHASVLDRHAESLTVSVPGVEDALCGLSRDGEFLGSAFTNGEGVAVIPVEGSMETGERLSLTVTSFETETYEGNLTVVAHPGCDVSPASIEIALEPGAATELDLLVANDGEEGSVLEFAIDVLPPGSKNISGSSVVADRTSYRPGTTFDIRFAITNQTPDYEWIKEAEIDFTHGVTVNSSTDFTVVGQSRKLLTDGSTGDGAEILWSSPGLWGEIYNGETAEAVVNVTVDDGFADEMQIEWKLGGDGWGDPPHVLYGEIVLPLDGPALVVHAPNGGETLRSGEVCPVLWASTPGLDEVSLDLSTDGGMSWVSIVRKIQNDGLYEWVVQAGASESCLLRVSSPDGAMFDVSDDPFRVIEPIAWLGVSPASGTLEAGETAAVSVQIDAAGLELGDREAVLVVYQNSGEPAHVPVMLHVTTIEVDPRWSSIEATVEVLLAPGGDADSTLRIVVTARDAEGRGIPGIQAGAVAVHASGVSSIGKSMIFCETGLPLASYFSAEPTDGDGRAVLEVRRVGGCGSVALSADVNGVSLMGSAAVIVRSPDLNGDGFVNFQDVFLYAPYLNAGTGHCGNLNGDSGEAVNFSDTVVFIPFLVEQSSCW
ncbi:MAG: C25 family cysteine peptidase [Candidatus Eisenbacteria bacterium]